MLFSWPNKSEVGNKPVQLAISCLDLASETTQCLALNFFPHILCFSQGPEQHKMRSQLAAQFMPFFRLIARILTFRDKKYRILTFRDKKYRILTFCDKTELYLTVLQQNNVEACLRCEASLSLVLSGSLWLALLLSLAPSCSLLLSQAPYCSLNLRTTSSLGSQGPCSARSGAAALQHFMLVWSLEWAGLY